MNSLWYGADRGASPLLPCCLVPLSLLYRGLVAVRSGLYAVGVLRRVHVGVPVVVVGNLSVGGTGKTPFLIWLAARLIELGYRPGIVSRGYGGAASTWPQHVKADSDPALVGDEPVLLAQRTGCAVVVGPDRAAAAEALVAAGEIDVVLSDDGLQHYRLARTLEIVLVDGVRGFGNGRFLPAGPLREPLSRLGRVAAVVVNGEALGEARDVAAVAAAGLCVRGRLEPLELARLGSEGGGRRLQDFAGQKVRAVAGIGNPERFFSMLEAAGLVVERYPLPDHAKLVAADLDAGVLPVLLTEKDAVKCRSIGHDKVWSVAVGMQFEPRDAAALVKCVVDVLPRPKVPQPPVE